MSATADALTDATLHHLGQLKNSCEVLSQCLEALQFYRNYITCPEYVYIVLLKGDALQGVYRVPSACVPDEDTLDRLDCNGLSRLLKEYHLFIPPLTVSSSPVRFLRK